MHVVSHGEPLSEHVKDDTWVGASIALVDVSPPSVTARHRFHFAARPEVYDWVAVVRASVK